MYFTCLPLITIKKRTKKLIEKYTHTQNKSMEICNFIIITNVLYSDLYRDKNSMKNQKKTKHNPLVHWFVLQILRKSVSFHQMDKIFNF